MVTPSYRQRTTKDGVLAVVTLTDGFGKRQEVRLGAYGSPESKSAYCRVLAEWECNGRRLLSSSEPEVLTISDLVTAFSRHAACYYRRRDGSPTQEIEDYKLSMRPLQFLYGSLEASKFGPLALKAVRWLMIKGYEHPVLGPQAALSRGVINQRVGRIKRMFKWAVEHELISPMVHHALTAVRGLEPGRGEARETEPVKPVASDCVLNVLPWVRPQVGAMLQLQMHTGMRSGEVTTMRGADIDMSGAVWLYRPAVHKTSYRGRTRVIAIGPKGQEVLRPWLRSNSEDYLFQPIEADRAYRRAQRLVRRTKVQPSQQHRSKRHPQRKPGERYTSCSYHRAVAEAIKKANHHMACEACRETELRCAACSEKMIPHFFPHQLRHTKATEIRAAAGLDAARAVRGHSTPIVTEVYAELDVAKAIEVMGRLG